MQVTRSGRSRPPGGGWIGALFPTPGRDELVTRTRTVTLPHWLWNRLDRGEIVQTGLRRIQVAMKLVLARLAVVLVPSYGVAWLTDKMVYVMPTVVAAALAAAAIREGMFSTRIDEADDETPDSEDG